MIYHDSVLAILNIAHLQQLQPEHKTELLPIIAVVVQNIGHSKLFIINFRQTPNPFKSSYTNFPLQTLKLKLKLKLK